MYDENFFLLFYMIFASLILWFLWIGEVAKFLIKVSNKDKIKILWYERRCLGCGFTALSGSKHCPIDGRRMIPDPIDVVYQLYWRYRNTSGDMDGNESREIREEGRGKKEVLCWSY